MKIIYYSFAASAALAGWTMTASASNAQEVRSEMVETVDLDLSNRTDRDLLNARIRRAAVDICKGLNGSQKSTVEECARRSVRQARAQRDNQIIRDMAGLARAGVSMRSTL